MKKKIGYLIITLILPLTFLVSCNDKKAAEKSNTIESKNYSLICPDGLPAIAASKFIDEADEIENFKLDVSIEESTDLLLSEFMKGKADFAIVPSNLALQSYKKDLGYKIMATVGWGSLYLVTTEEEASIDELKGKEIYNTGKGLTPDIVFKEILNKNGLTEDDVTLSYVGAASELAPMVLSKQVKYAVLPEPVLSNVKSKNADLKIICSLNEQWKAVEDAENGYPQSTLLIKDSVYDEIKDTKLYTNIMNKFQETESEVVNKPDSVIDICNNLGITVNAETISSALSNSNLKFTPIIENTNDYIKYFNLINENKEEDYDSLFIKE